MTNLLQNDLSQPIEGLATWTYTVITAGDYTTQVKSTLPANSQLGIIIQSNSVNLVTQGGATNNPTPTRRSLGASASSYYSTGDTVSVILSSTAAADKIPNAVKSMVNLYFGI